MKQAIVIDKNNIKVEFVLVDEKNKPMYYELKDEEKLIFEKIGNSFNLVKAKWTGTDWVESATKEEIEKARPKPLQQVPSEAELMVIELTNTLAQMQANSAQAIAEMTNMIAMMSIPQ